MCEAPSGGWVRRKSRYDVRRRDFCCRAAGVAFVKSSRAARCAVVSRMEGLESWYPGAPGRGRNSKKRRQECMLVRLDLVFVGEEGRGLRVSI